MRAEAGPLCIAEQEACEPYDLSGALGGGGGGGSSIEQLPALAVGASDKLSAPLPRIPVACAQIAPSVPKDITIWRSFAARYRSGP